MSLNRLQLNLKLAHLLPSEKCEGGFFAVVSTDNERVIVKLYSNRHSRFIGNATIPLQTALGNCEVSVRGKHGEYLGFLHVRIRVLQGLESPSLPGFAEKTELRVAVCTPGKWSWRAWRYSLLELRSGKNDAVFPCFRERFRRLLRR